MKKKMFVALAGVIMAACILSSCSSGASQQSWHPKQGKKPKPGHNR